MMRLPALAALCVFWPAMLWPALAGAAPCEGRDLIAALPPAELAALKAEAEVPFAHGNLWTATRDGQTITLAGTYHLADPRFAPMLARLDPALSDARALLVEAGPKEETALKARVASDLSLLMLPAGQTLKDQMQPEDWQSLSAAMTARHMPPAVGARLQPWMLTSLLSMPACLFPLGPQDDQGLDKQLISKAIARNLPIVALEPYDTIFQIFAGFSPKDQIAFLNQTVATDAQSDDMAATLGAAYFAGESQLFATFSQRQLLALPGMTKTEADREAALVDGAMIAGRNARWIAVLEAEAAKGPVLAAFGALHLPGEKGVLNLLAQRGWTITPLP
jgi:hypothetical protein